MHAPTIDAVRRAASSGWLVDVVVGVGIAALNVTTSLTPDVSESAYDYRQSHLVLVVSVMAASGLVLIWRRDAPVTVAATTLGIFALVTLAEWQPGSIAVSVMLALYTVGAHSSRRDGLGCVAGLVVSCLAFTTLGKPYFDGWISLVSVPVFVAPWFLGRVALRYREAGERERARVIALERQQAVEAERAVHQERLRIARELHDIISHTLTVVTVQSSVARHLVGDGNAASGALSVIEDSSRAALEDLRRMLAVLRDRDGSPNLAPSPGLNELTVLAATHRAAHGPVELSIGEGVVSAPESLRLTVFRLVQESLTNIARHARGASAWVSVQSDGDRVIVTIVDDGVAAAPTVESEQSSYGLIGMNERVALFGGTLEVGPQPQGGFRVRAVLPLEVAR